MESINPTLIDVGVFVVIAVFLLGGVKQVLGIVDHFKMKPPPGDQFVKIPQCQEFRQLGRTTVEQRLDDVEVMQKELDRGDRKGRSDIHRDVRRVEERVSKLEGQIELFGQRQISQSNILDRILSELGEMKGQIRKT